MADLLCETTRPATARHLPALLDTIDGVLSGGGVEPKDAVALRRAAAEVCSRIVGSSRWRARGEVTIGIGVDARSAWVVVCRRGVSRGRGSMAGPIPMGWERLNELVDRVEYRPHQPTPPDESLLLLVNRAVR